MISIQTYNYQNGSSFLNDTSNLQKLAQSRTTTKIATPKNPFISKKFAFRVCAEPQGKEGNGNNAQKKRTFLSLEEAGLVEISGLGTHERFLCRLTISSLNLLRVISEEEGCSIEDLNAGKLCDWFLKDKLKREQNLDSAVLQWDDSELQF